MAPTGEGGTGAESQQVVQWFIVLICMVYKHSWQLVMSLTRGSDSVRGSQVFVNRMYPKKPWSYLVCLVTHYCNILLESQAKASIHNYVCTKQGPTWEGRVRNSHAHTHVPYKLDSASDNE